MNPEQETKLFETERKDTDDSLIAERDKATRSLSSASLKSQGQTDDIMKDERSIADQMTASSRANHDETRNSNLKSATDSADQARIQEERRRADLATGLERSRMDEAILAERNHASKIVTKVLDEERKATDHNLLVERNTTDANCVGSSNLLKTEVAEHQKTKISLTSREEFLAIVSHDLRNPIGAISSYADLILEGLGDTELGPETFKFVSAMKRNADISLRLISDLLDLERISQNKLEMTFKSSSVKEILTEALEIFLPQAREKGISVRADVEMRDVFIECDRDRILQVVSNLIGNALKYAADGGNIVVGAFDKGSSVEIFVKDDGGGIPLNKQSKIFERFAQLSSNDRTGLGLGLYISKTLVEGHGGKLWLESEVHKGSTFYFSIPKIHLTR